MPPALFSGLCRIVGVCLASASLLSFTAGPAAHAAEPAVVPQPTQTMPLRWIVNTGELPIERVLTALNLRLGVPVKVVRPMLQPGSTLVELGRLPLLGNLQQVQDVAAVLGNIPGVVFASPDLSLRRAAVPAPNDPLYQSAQAAYLDQGAYAALNMRRAWLTTRGSASVTVAVLDSGALYQHPELKGRLLPGYDFVSQVTPMTGTRETGTFSTSGSNDGDGRDADASDPGDAPPAGFRCPDTSTTSSFHGTAVASVLAAQSNNGNFLTGMDWNARVLPVRVSGRCGIAFSSDIADAMYWAAGTGRSVAGVPANPNPARILNFSFAGDSPFAGACARDAVGVAIAQLRAQGVLVVVSAGNNNGGPIQFPANCPGAVAVGAASSDGRLAAYSAKGTALGVVTLTAPGDAQARYVGANNSGVASGANRGQPSATGHNTLLFQGTSFSAPLVAGALSLVMAARPDFTAQQALDTLVATVRPYPAGADFRFGLLGGFSRSNCTSSSCGRGLIDPVAAIESAVKDRPVANVPQSVLATSSGGVVIDASLSSNAARVSSGLTYRWDQTQGNPTVLQSVTSPVLTVQSGLAGNVAQYRLTVTDTQTNQTHASEVRVVSAGADERTFSASGSSAGGGSVVTPSETGGSSGSASTSAGGGGGGGAFGLPGLCLMALLMLLWHQPKAAGRGLRR
ncbi:MAG: S8 family serine peptidase [Limnobacter sp.]|uniref:S8 family serine peptidase n=1 Tax=Limnobacter sp. TaxID=2003368 RepID=UPI00391A21E4